MIRKAMNKKHQIPTTAHPHKRREALPWQQPKATEEDPEALRLVQAILNSPSYRRADNDIDFLARDGLRGVRLQIDYLKPELLLEEHEIHQTIVVFGSTRICEPMAARRKVEALRASLAVDPSNMELGRQLAIAERIHAKSHYYEVAREFGRLVGSANHGGRKDHTVIVTGGGPGMRRVLAFVAFERRLVMRLRLFAPLRAKVTLVGTVAGCLKPQRRSGGNSIGRSPGATPFRILCT